MKTIGHFFTTSNFTHKKVKYDDEGKEYFELSKSYKLFTFQGITFHAVFMMSRKDQINNFEMFFKGFICYSNKNFDTLW